MWVLDFVFTPVKVTPVSWQFAQGIPATAARVCPVVPIVQPVVKPAVAVPVREWQDSQGVAPTGIWMDEDKVTRVGAL
jgi:hypothetical protein